MSYEHGTTHYNLPQTEGSDTRDWFDTNECFADIDAAIYAAGQTAEAAKTDLTEVKTDIQGLKEADTAMTGRVDGIDTRVGAAELKIDRLQDEVIDDNQDLKDAICSIEEASATAAYPHNTGEFFWYNDTLYKATANIAIGQQIVPDTNCKTTNITTELLAGGSGGVEIDDTVVSATKVWSSYKTNEEITTASAVKTGDTRFYSGKLQYYDGSAWVDAPVGGGSMKVYHGKVTLPASSDASVTVDITSLGLTSVDDYYVIVDMDGASHNAGGAIYQWGVGSCYLDDFTATSFKIKRSTNVENTTTVSYQVVYNS